MATLTGKRLEAAKDILESYRKRVHETGSMDSRQFEADLRKRWDVGYKTIKSIVIDMAKNNKRYLYLAVYFMEHENPSGVNADFRSTLVKIYDTRHVSGEERDAKNAKFWSKIAPKQK